METKILINRSNNKRRENWYSLVQTSKGYAIEHQENRRAAPVNYHEVSSRFAQSIIELASKDRERATEAMAREVHK
jgi:predicted nucleic-acid-binding protein